MQRFEIQRRKTYIVRLTLVQLGVALLAGLIAYSTAHISGVLSVITGALVALLPQAFFIQRMGVLRSKRSSRHNAVDLFRAEAGKFGLTVALFSAVFVTVPPSNPAFFFSTYAAVVLTHWLAPWLMQRNRTLD